MQNKKKYAREDVLVQCVEQQHPSPPQKKILSKSKRNISQTKSKISLLNYFPVVPEQCEI